MSTRGAGRTGSTGWSGRAGQMLRSARSRTRHYRVLAGTVAAPATAGGPGAGRPRSPGPAKTSRSMSTLSPPSPRPWRRTAPGCTSRTRRMSSSSRTSCTSPPTSPGSPTTTRRHSGWPPRCTRAPRSAHRPRPPSAVELRGVEHHRIGAEVLQLVAHRRISSALAISA